MSKNNLKICILLKIFMILICLGLLCSGNFNTSGSLYLLSDASAQYLYLNPDMVAGYWSPSPLAGMGGPNLWAHPYLGPIAPDYYNMSNLSSMNPYTNVMTQPAPYQFSNIGSSYPFDLMAFTPGYSYMNNINSFLPGSVSQTNQWMTSSPMYQSTQILFAPWMASYQPAANIWTLSSQSVYNPGIYPAYIYTPYDYSYDYSYDDSYYDDGTTALYGKPAIYLYPEEDTNVIVHLDLNGEITKSDPDYQGGWNVFVDVTVDGTTKYSTIYDENDSVYDYLFWEGAFEHSSLVLPGTGWIVAREDLEAWFNENLNALGLNDYEKQQFMEYWVVRLHDSPYYEIKLVDQEIMNNNATLSIITSEGSVPDTLIRIILHFHGLVANGYIEAPQIVIPDRNGFVVVEWGGILY